MSRTIEIKAQQIDSYKLHFSKQSDKEIHLRLAEYYQGKTVSMRTLKKWTSKFKNLDPELIKDDSEFEWNKCEEHSIPWPQSRRIIDTWATLSPADLSLESQTLPVDFVFDTADHEPLA